MLAAFVFFILRRKHQQRRRIRDAYKVEAQEKRDELEKVTAENAKLQNNVVSKEEEMKRMLQQLDMAGLEEYALIHADIEFQQQLGQGAFGTVWRGKWKGNMVAVKTALVDNDKDVPLKQSRKILKKFRGEMKAS